MKPAKKGSMGEEIITRRDFYIIRLLVIIGISYLALFTPSAGKQSLLSYSYIAFYLSTNLLLPYIPQKILFNKKIFSVLILFDSAMIALGIYLSGRAGTDFYLIYFIIIGIASMSISLKYLMINTILFTSLYGWILFKQNLFSGDMAVSYALRLPFMVIIALFFGYLVETILKDKERDLRESEEKYRQLFNAESDAIIIFDAETGLATDMNDAALALYGYSPKDFSRLKYSHILAFSQKDEEREERCLNENRGDAQFQYHCRKDGKVFPVEMTAGSFVVGNRRMVSAVIKDITTRMRVEDALRESQSMLKASEKRLNSIVKAVPDIIYRLDVKGDITFINDSVTKYGYSAEELIGKNILDIVHPGDREKVSRKINERRTGDRRTTELEARILAKDPDQDGSDFNSGDFEKFGYFLIESEGIYDSTRPKEVTFIGTQGIAREISARKRLEAQFQHSQKMEALGTITSGVAHNFRNTLAGVSVNRELLQMKYPDDEEIHEIARRLQAEVKRGVQMVESLMQFSRKGKTDTFENVNLVEVIEETYNLISKSFDKRIDIHIDLPEELPVSGEMSGLSQVFMNLCTNA
ncbi:MAG: PAS domain S-box protein, partial [Deltaproteobacteria bacterium]|nr:PAS domain S-box protein [Deltaproteobacteria bacterium]